MNSPCIFLTFTKGKRRINRTFFDINVRLIQDLPGIHLLIKLTVNEGFLAVGSGNEI